MFINVETDEVDPNDYRTTRWFLTQDYDEPDGMHLKANQELIVTHGDDTHAICEVVRDYETLEDWQVKIPLSMIVQKTYEVKLVNVKRLG